MSITGVRDFYFSAYLRCRLDGDEVPSARAIQELVSELDISAKVCTHPDLRIGDPERPAREIESAHACLKNRLVAAAHAKNWSFLADAIEASTITEEPSELIVDTPRTWRLRFSGPDFIEVIQLAGETRTVRSAWKAAA
jgi:hypothetical protein